MICLVRHGERADNCHIEREFVVNSNDPHLTPLGCKQAIKAGVTLKDVIKDFSNIEVYSSPFLRCIMTASNIIKQIEKKDITVKSQICETLYSHLFKSDPLPNLHFNINKSEKYFKGMHLKDEQIDEFPQYPETLENVNKRTIEYTEQLLTNIKDDQCIILVTHQRMLKSILEYFGEDSSNVGYCKIVTIKKQSHFPSLNECLISSI